MASWPPGVAGPVNIVLYSNTANSWFSLWGKKYAKWAHNCSFWVVFYLPLQYNCLACWESQRDKNYSLWENLSSYQTKIFSFWERVGNKRTFFCLTEINIIFTEIHHIKTKPNKKTLSVVAIAMICSKLASLWKFQYFRRHSRTSIMEH